MLTLFTALGGAIITALVSLGTAFYHVYSARKEAEAQPDIKANTQARIDNDIETEAEEAIQKTDKGDPSDERRGDAA